MTTFTFLHAADLHLDTPFEGIGAAAPHVRQALRDASLDAWDALVDLAIGRRVAFVLLAGDVYDGAARGVRAEFRVRAGLQRLAAAGIRTFIIHGNHDPLDGWASPAAFPPEVTTFGSEEVASHPVQIGGTTVATVHGISYATAATHENLARRFPARAGEGIRIGLLHCTVGGAAEHEPYAPCTLDDLRAAGYDYWALGHIHARSIQQAGGPWVVYPGNLQGRSPKPSEQGAKGACVVEVRAGVVREPEFVALDRVRFLPCEVAIDGLTELAAIGDRLADAVEDLRGDHQGRGLMLRVHLTGRGELHTRLQRHADRDELVESLRERYRAAQPLVWIESLQVATRSPLDREEVRRRGDFSSELVKRVDALEADPARLEPELATPMSEQMSGNVVRQLEQLGLMETDLAALLAEAETIALDLLEEGARS